MIAIHYRHYMFCLVVQRTLRFPGLVALQHSSAALARQPSLLPTVLLILEVGNDLVEKEN
eukprot:165289-Pyramimonas_sp.AAC.1